MEKPIIIDKLNDDLMALVSADNKPYLNTEAVAKFMGMDPSCLRHAIYNNQCPFGVGASKQSYGNGFVKISKLAFYNWITKGVV